MSVYYRVKKFRELKRRLGERTKNVRAVRKDCADATSYSKENRDTIYETDNTHTRVHTHVHVDKEFLEHISDTSMNSETAPLEDDVQQPHLEINYKIQQWALKHLSTLRLNVITDLLVLLTDKGHTTLPKTAQSLLGTKHYRALQVMPSNRETDGKYMYLGIRTALKKIISTDIYREKEISLLIHVDGMQIYNNAQMQVWPISAKLCHTEYVSKPFVVGIYCGDSKPQNSNDFLQDFVEEATKLITNGVELHGTQYSLKICAVIADAPARAFIKSCKPPNSFYACERCFTKGISVGTKPCIKRVYPEIDCRKRDKTSFENKEQVLHHIGDVQTVLLQLPNFDIINSVVIDSMHLLYLGVMKNLLEKWLMKKSVAGLKKQTVRRLKDVMLSICKDIPCEFQRKTCDLNILPRWKATQYRFFLLYCGTILREALPENFYRHFLLLFVACRLLHMPNPSVTHCEYASVFLRKFVYLFPSLYGEQSQVLNIHYLIHVADDVRNFKMSLNELSAFWGESYISIFKKLVKSPKKPLTQIVNRLCELESQPSNVIRHKQYLDKCILQDNITYIVEEEEYTAVSSIKVNDVLLKCVHPDNVIQLNDNRIIKIESIMLKKCENRLRIQNLYVLGYELDDPRETFNYPLSSREIGISTGKTFSQCKDMFALKDLRCKCILLNLDSCYYVIALLHTM